MSQQDDKAVVNEIQLGAIKASIRLNKESKASRYCVTVCRLYKDIEGWIGTNEFSRDDLPVLLKVIEMADTWIRRNE